MTKTFTIYRSSAGSGKTRTLAKEYLKLALRYRAHYFKHILAVTFTNKATQEMKDRILAYLNEFANGTPGDLADELKDELKLDALTFQQYAQEAQAAILHDYSQFSISTIDAFFQKVIRAFTREAGLSGDYRLEIDQDAVLEEVIANLIDELGNNKELTDWVVEFARENLENERSWDVRNSLLDFSREIFREEFKLIEDDVIKVTSQPRYFRKLKSRLMETRSRFLNALSKPAREAVEILNKQAWDISDIMYGKQSGLLTFLRNCAFSRKVSDLREAGERVRTLAADPSAWPGKKTPHRAAIVRVAEAELVPRLQQILPLLENGITDALSAEIALQNLYVFGLVSDISRKLREYKFEHNLMLLADAPKFLNGVIQDSETPFVYEKVGSFYRNYLIDEFQDTSGLQWKNFLPLLSNSLDQGYPSLVVGDVKQAIYRWRGGDLKLLHRTVEENVGPERVEIRNLNNNFRSARIVVGFNNALFESSAAIVSRETGHELSLSAYQDAVQHVSKTEEGSVKIRFIRDDAGQRWKEMALERIPEYLEQLQGAGVPLREVAILVRRNDEGQDIVNYLLQHRLSDRAKPGMRYDVVSGESLRIDSAATVNLLEGAMKYLLNPDDALARAQLSFEFARMFHPERPITEVFSVTNAATFESYLPTAFTKQKGALKKLPLFELTETLIEIFRLGQRTGELPYLQAFQNLVLDFFTRERNDLGAFLEWWEFNRQKKSIPVSGQVDAAQIISIHKSKGLQFRYVLIPFCSWAMDHDGMKAPQLWVKSDEPGFREAGFIPVKYGSVLERTHFRAFYEEEKIRTCLDNLNLLYVAFTRAETGLTVFAPHPENKSSKKTVSGLLYDAIAGSSTLRGFFNDATATFENGSVTTAVAQSPLAEGHTVPLDRYPASSWREKLVIRRKAGGFFEENEGRSERINYGIHLHAVLSRIRHASEIAEVLTTLEREGTVSAEERLQLQEELQNLLENENVRSWFTGDWEVRTEVPILLPGGAENRIDRLLISGRRVVVIDFKTGEPVRADEKQVSDYLDVMRRMNYVDVEGFLLYVRTGEVIKVAPSRSRVSRKKADNQLDLNL